jgi:adenylate kinase
MPKVIYLTGAPAAGKSSMTRLLMERVPELVIWEYGARLTEHVRARSSGVKTQEDLRTRSAGVVSPEDVAEVDQALLDFVEANRAVRNVIIDSHPVTKEEYGFRITPFSLEQFGRLCPNEIWVLYASPVETRRRISIDRGGRPMVTEEEAGMHTALQASLAATYAMSIGCPAYLFDTATHRDELVDRLVTRLS